MARGLIVHPTDLGEASEGAFHHALALGLALRGRLALVHVHSHGERRPEGAAFPPVRDTLAHWGLIPPGAPQAAVAALLDLQVSKAEVAAENPEAGLVKLLRDEDAQMVVLGTRGLDGMQRLIEGSFSQQVAREARLPALFVPQAAAGFVDPASGAVRLKTVLIPVAERPDAASAIAAAVRLDELFGQAAEFHLLHVDHGRSVPDLQVDIGVRRHDHIRHGPVVETIVALAEEVDADLIVMATAGHKGILDALRGSTTEAVMRRARRALLATPAR